MRVPGDYLGISKKVIIRGELGLAVNWIEVSLSSDALGTERPILLRIGKDNIFAKYYRDGYWINYGPEEQSNEYPLRANQPFVMEIERTLRGYRVTINGELFHDYTYHLDRELGRYVNISGEAIFSINSIEFEKTD